MPKPVTGFVGRGFVFVCVGGVKKRAGGVRGGEALLLLGIVVRVLFLFCSLLVMEVVVIVLFDFCWGRW